ncbi:MAG: hypothetical protein ACOYNN_11765, partial [Terrimicrobiaceae bacterium]
NVRPGGYFAPTKVPPGSYRAEISDSRKPDALDQFPLAIAGNTLVVTKGDDKLGCRALVIEEQGRSSVSGDAANSPSSGKKSREVVFINGIADGKLTIVLPGDPPRLVEVEDMTSVALSPEVLATEITAKLIAADGKTRSEKLRLASYTQNGAVVVFHCDEVEQQIVRFSVLDGSSFRMLSVDDSPKPSE